MSLHLLVLKRYARFVAACSDAPLHTTGYKFHKGCPLFFIPFQTSAVRNTLYGISVIFCLFISFSSDLGWRRLPGSVTVPVGGVASGVICNSPTEWTSSVTEPQPHHRRNDEPGSATTSRVPPSLYPSRRSWNVYFVNDRSGHFCNVSIVTLAINIAIRAEGLAEAFGLVNDPEFLNTSAGGLCQGSTSASSVDGVVVPSGRKENVVGLRGDVAASTAADPDSHHKVRVEYWEGRPLSC